MADELISGPDETDVVQLSHLKIQQLPAAVSMLDNEQKEAIQHLNDKKGFYQRNRMTTTQRRKVEICLALTVLALLKIPYKLDTILHLREVFDKTSIIFCKTWSDWKGLANFQYRLLKAMRYALDNKTDVAMSVGDTACMVALRCVINVPGTFADGHRMLLWQLNHGWETATQVIELLAENNNFHVIQTPISIHDDDPRLVEIAAILNRAVNIQANAKQEEDEVLRRANSNRQTDNDTLQTQWRIANSPSSLHATSALRDAEYWVVDHLTLSRQEVMAEHAELLNHLRHWWNADQGKLLARVKRNLPLEQIRVLAPEDKAHIFAWSQAHGGDVSNLMKDINIQEDKETLLTARERKVSSPNQFGDQIKLLEMRLSRADDSMEVYREIVKIKEATIERQSRTAECQSKTIEQQSNTIRLLENNITECMESLAGHAALMTQLQGDFASHDGDTDTLIAEPNDS